MADQTIVTDGQYDWSKGMDSSRSALISDPKCVNLAVNTTFRGGRAKTRPGFQQIFLTDDPDYPGSLDLFATGKVTNGATGVVTKTGNYFQGSFFYVNKTDPGKSCLIAVSGGYVFRIAPALGYVARLDIDYNPGNTLIPSTFEVPTPPIYISGFRVDATKEVYFCQAEKYLIMQNGVDRPWVWDGDGLFQTGVGINYLDSTAINMRTASMPIGTHMAYGQGRLFIASPTKDSFQAGDIVFGGSTEEIPISQSIQGPYAFISTSPSQHGFQTGDVVSISGHSSTPNINGTWRVLGTNQTGFTISAGLTNGGVGGQVVKSNEGDESDLLRFTETRYLNEGGFLQIPSSMGSIRGMAFQPMGDTATGQGDLLVFGEQGVASFAVSTPRDQWKATPGFQRVALSNIGLVSSRTLVPINNDLFFRSLDGLRAYRNARAQQDGYNITPLSVELDAILDFDTEGLLSASSAVYFDNRLLFTVSPRENFYNIESEIIKYRPISFQGIGVLDFNSMGVAGDKSPAIFDGVWTGLEVLQLVTGVTNRLPRCFIFSYDTESNSNQLWENYPWALFDYPLGVSQRKIAAAVNTRGFDFQLPWNLKKLERGDMWIGELSGDTSVNVYYRPDENPCWFPWHSFSTCSETETCISALADVTAISGFQAARASGRTVERAGEWKLTFKNQVPFRIRIANTTGAQLGELTPFGYLHPLSEIYTDVIEWPLSTAKISSALQMALWKDFANTSSVNSGTYYAIIPAVVELSPQEYVIAFYRVNVTFTKTSTTWNVSIPSGTVIQANSVLAVEGPRVIAATPECGVYKPVNVKDQYRNQIRLPTPSNSCVTSTGTIARVGHSFQFRFEWEGQFALTKIMFHASRLVEPVGGNCT